MHINIQTVHAQQWCCRNLIINYDVWYTKKLLSSSHTHARTPHKVCVKNTLTAAENVSYTNELTLIHSTQNWHVKGQCSSKINT